MKARDPVAPLAASVEASPSHTPSTALEILRIEPQDGEPFDVVAVGAHPDDVEIACGGTLAKLARQGYRVGIVDLTDGEPTPLSSGREQRLLEAQKAATVLGVHGRVTLNLPNRKLMDGFEARVALARVFRRWKPKVVIGFGDKTPMASPDHWQAMQITDAAVFYSRLTKWDEQFDGLPPHAISHQLYFRLAFETGHAWSAGNTFTQDISDTLDVKIAAVRCYVSQFPPNKEHVFDRIRGAALLAGAAAGFAAGEVFVTVRPIGTQDLVRFLFHVR
jgi:LmbE family N-acetylglucosaminyl deacetylase